MNNSYKSITTILNSGIQLTIYKMNIQEAEELIEKQNGQLLDQYSGIGSKIYQLEDGSILSVIMNYSAGLYASLTDYLMMLQDTDKSINHYHKQRWFIENNGTIHSYQQLAREEALELLTQDNVYRALVISGKIDSRKDFILENGQILILRNANEPSSLFESTDKYEMYVKSLSGHMLRGLDRYRDEFTDHVSEMITELAQVLDLKLDLLDKSPKSIKLIDKKLDSIIITDLFFLKNVLNLITYCGEVYIKKRGGRWKMRKEYDTWVPVITTSEYLWKDVYESLDPKESIRRSLYLAIF